MEYLGCVYFILDPEVVFVKMSDETDYMLSQQLNRMAFFTYDW